MGRGGEKVAEGGLNPNPPGVAIPEVPRRTVEGPFDAIVVGAGIAGSSVAFRLGREGRKVLVLERDLQQPDRIVGELLQPGGYLKLKELGLAQCVEGIDAVTVNGYAIFKGEDVAVTKYPVAQGSDVAGRSFHHGRFVQQLRVAAGGVEGVSAARAVTRPDPPAPRSFRLPAPPDAESPAAPHRWR